jgi:hypothetical protein
MSSIATFRQTLADALSTATGVRGVVKRPATPRAGDAWPLWDGAERGDGGAFMMSWRVRVFLPQDEVAASEWVDAHLDDVYDAIQPVAFVESFRPVVVPTSSGEQFALDITVRSE